VNKDFQKLLTQQVDNIGKFCMFMYWLDKVVVTCEQNSCADVLFLRVYET